MATMSIRETVVIVVFLFKRATLPNLLADFHVRCFRDSKIKDGKFGVKMLTLLENHIGNNILLARTEHQMLLVFPPLVLSKPFQK